MTEKPDFTGLRAMYINCTLNRSPGRSHTQGVIDRSVAIMKANGVSVDQIRAVDHDIAAGVRPDMTEHGWDTDEWPTLLNRVMAADILVIAGPIWLGDNSSVTRRVIERLYGYSGVLN
ncbi:flavodoxin family protein [Micromonospora sp. RP3T]|uniref:flavodoxin family protein n=1 Tax=Micromonospora sp. RP3T TaxID=2135446 RepID=UPI003D705A5B